MCVCVWRGLVKSFKVFPVHGFQYHAGDNNIIFKDKLKSTPE